MALSCSAAPMATVSAPRRDRANVRVRAPVEMMRPMTSAASVVAARRTGAPCSPVMSSRKPGSQRAMVRWPMGEPSSVTAATSERPVNLCAWAEGSTLVAEARITTGGFSTRRRSRRSTSATCAPKTPRYTWHSSITTYFRVRSRRVQDFWLPKIEACNISGLVTMIRACSRITRRASAGVSPS